MFVNELFHLAESDECSAIVEIFLFFLVLRLLYAILMSLCMDKEPTFLISSLQGMKGAINECVSNR